MMKELYFLFLLSELKTFYIPIILSFKNYYNYSIIALNHEY